MNRTGVGVAVLLAIGVIVALMIALWPDADTAPPADPPPTPRAHESIAVETPAASPVTGAVIFHPSRPPAAEASPSATSTAVITDPTRWARMSRKDFGCMLERDIGYRDHLWNCSSEEPPAGDPCRDMENFYRGPQIPPELGSKVSPLVERVELHWEHGNLQEIDITFRANVGDREIQEAFALPSTLRIARDNVDSSDLRDVGGNQRQLVIKGFERNGDLNCGDGRQPD